MSSVKTMFINYVVSKLREEGHLDNAKKISLFKDALAERLLEKQRLRLSPEECSEFYRDVLPLILSDEALFGLIEKGALTMIVDQHGKIGYLRNDGVLAVLGL